MRGGEGSEDPREGISGGIEAPPRSPAIFEMPVAAIGRWRLRRSTVSEATAWALDASGFGEVATRATDRSIAGADARLARDTVRPSVSSATKGKDDRPRRSGSLTSRGTVAMARP